MNPEFQRNLWLEAGRTRLAWTAVTMAAIYGAVLLIAHDRLISVLGVVGAVVFVASALIWGPRAAGSAVAEEVRQRTWDFQRLSALTPWEMTWGKLLGATSLTWVSAATGLVVAFVCTLVGGNLVQAFQWAIGAVAAAVLLQAGSMAIALVGVRRARAEGRTPSFRFTFGGLIGLFVIVGAAQRVFPTRGLGRNGLFDFMGGSDGQLQWWGLFVSSGWFTVLSVIAFAAWTLVAAWRLMRLELQMRNGPWIWPAFVVFAGLWAAGLADAGLTMRFAVAGAVFAACAYVGVFADPADRVRMRQFGDAVKRLDFPAMLSTVPLVVAPVKLALLAVIGVAASPFLGEGDDPSALLALAALAFLLRDLAIVAYFRFGPRPGRGDFGAALGLFLVYFVGGVVGHSLGEGGTALFTPSPIMPAISVFSAGVQAAAIWFLVWRRVRAPEVSQAV